MNEYLNGVFVGFVTAWLAILGLFVHFFLRTGSISAPTPRIFIKLDKQPNTDIEDDVSTVEETMLWLNNLLKRLCRDAMSSEYSYELMRSRLEQLMNSRMPAEFVEPVCIISMHVGSLPSIKSIKSNKKLVRLSIEWTEKECFAIKIVSALCYKSMIALPFEAELSVNSIKTEVSLTLHTHYLELQLFNFLLDVDLKTQIGHSTKISDCAALNDYLKAMILGHVRRSLVDQPLIVPYANFMVFIPRVLSPAMSPIPKDELFASTAELHDSVVPGSFH